MVPSRPSRSFAQQYYNTSARLAPQPAVLLFSCYLEKKGGVQDEKLESFLSNNLPGMLICLLIAVPSWLLGKRFPVIGVL